MNELKNTSYANRGMWLENIINDTNTYYINKDIAIVYKKPTPIKVLGVSYRTEKTTMINKAIYAQASTLDYVGIYKGKYIEFDAKECHNKTAFALNNIKPHQLMHIKRIISHGGIAFLIIFMNNLFYLLDGQTLITFINNSNRKSIPYDYIQKNAHIIKEGYTPRINYVEIIDRLYIKDGE